MNDHNKLLQESTKGKTKEIAYVMGCTPNTVNREMNGEIKFNFLDKALPYMNACDNDEIINYLAASQGGFFFRDIYRDGWKDYRIVQSILKEFSELFVEVSDSLQDGVIDREEEKRIDKEWGDLQGVMQSFKRAIKRGEFSEKAKDQSEK